MCCPSSSSRQNSSSGSGSSSPPNSPVQNCPQNQPAFIRYLDNTNAVIPASESFQVSNFVTDNGLPIAGATTFAGTSTDPDNFRIEVEDPCATGASVQATLEVLRGANLGAAQLISSNTYTLNLHTGPKWRSLFLRVVSDGDDDAASGNGVASDPDNQTILVKLGDTLRATYTPASGTAVTVELNVGRPVSENNNGANGRLHDIRELKVNILVFQRPGMANTPARTRAEVLADIENTNERLAQACIRLNVTNINMGGAGDPGVALPAALAGGFTESPGLINNFNATELAVIALKDADANSLDLFYVDTITNTPRAVSYPAVRNLSADPNAKNFVVTSRGATVLSLAHEIMHILLNSPHRANEPNTALFRGGTTPNKSVGGTKRIGPYPDASAVGVGNADTTTIRGVAEALP
jgi:hypothetical protein